MRTGSRGLPRQEPAEARAPAGRDARSGEPSVRTAVRDAGPHEGRPAGRLRAERCRHGRAPGAEARRESSKTAQSEAGSVVIFPFNPKSIEKLSKDFKQESKRIRLRGFKRSPHPPPPQNIENDAKAAEVGAGNAERVRSAGPDTAARLGGVEAKRAPGVHFEVEPIGLS